MMMDDKGLTILCVFGLPPWSHQNEALFSVKAALKIHRKLKRHVPTFAIGVATGYVYTGAVGSGLRCDHTVLGDCVNMAARLMSHSLAKQSVLCDETTFNLAREKFGFDKPEPIMVKVLGRMGGILGEE